MSVPPTGTVTFLFTDIEGSTKMWERDAARMQAALGGMTRSYRAPSRPTAATCSRPSVMPSVPLSAQPRSPRRCPGGAADSAGRRMGRGLLIRARMALHSGEAEERDGDYFGPTLNRVARLLSTGHGGQILVSRAARELAGDRLPPGTSLEDLGEQRLKDLTRPERIFQVLAPELPTDFPALKTLDARRNNLPAQPSALVGREREISEVCGRRGNQVSASSPSRGQAAPARRASASKPQRTSSRRTGTASSSWPWPT